MTEKSTRHFRIGEVKAKILELILENDGPIKEPEIRERLSESFNEITQSTINKHLNYLKEKGCIERVSPSEKTRFLFWDVISFDQLKNIRSEFKDIQLNNYEKAILIILHENGYDVKQLSGFYIYFQLLLSDSFFKACIDTNLETLNKRMFNIYRYKDALGEWLISDGFNESYESYINNRLTTKISKDDFHRILTELAYGNELEYGTKDGEIPNIESLVEKWNEKIKTISKETPIELSAITEDEDRQPFRNMQRAIYFLKSFSRRFNTLFFNSFFEAYFYQDVMLDIASKEEIDFAVATKGSLDRFDAVRSLKKDNSQYYREMILSDLKEASKLMESHKQPLIFDKKIYDDSHEIFLYLEELFSNEIQEKSKSVNYSKD
jgi:Fe2+ or Zn2+ uptake regulation protein